MAVDKLVDSTKLDACLDAEADAIRAKTGGSADIPFDFANNKGFADAIAAISSGDEVFFSGFNGAPYFRNVVIPEGNYSGYPVFRSCPNLETLVINSAHNNVTSVNIWGYNASLKHAVINAAMNATNNNREFQNDTALETVQLGGVGRAITRSINLNFFQGCTQNGLAITIYVADDATLPLTDSPWGATNATIIYRSATTGEVIPV